MMLDPEQFSKEIGRCLRQARMSRGWSLAVAEAESRGRWGKAVLCSYETASRCVKVETLVELAAWLGLDLKAMLDAAWDAAGGEMPQEQADAEAEAA